MSFSIRPFHPSDLPALYRICILTADSGDDITPKFNDPDLIAHVYVGPYAVAEPDLTFVLTLNHRPIGYVVGVRDMAAFGQWCEAHWFPPLRQQYPIDGQYKTAAERSVVQTVHRGLETVNHFPGFPAHLHIDILPEGQGHGFGRKLMERLWDQLREIGVPGVHLGVSKENANAIKFYHHIGFQELTEQAWGAMLGKVL